MKTEKLFFKKVIRIPQVCLALWFVFFIQATYGHQTNPVIQARNITKLENDTNRIKSLIERGEVYLFRNGSLKSDLDSATFFFTMAKLIADRDHLLKWNLEVLKIQGDCYLEGHDLIKGKAYFTQVTDFYRGHNDKSHEAATWSRYGDCVPLDAGPGLPRFADEKIQCYKNAQQLFIAINDKVSAIGMSKNIADVHLEIRDLPLAKQELLQVVAQYKAIGYNRLHDTYYLLSALCRLQGNLNEELYYSLECIKSMEATRDTAEAMGFYYRLSQNYRDLGKYKQSLYYLKKAKSSAIAKKDAHVIYLMAVAEVKLLILFGRPQQALETFTKTIKTLTADEAYKRYQKNYGLALCFEALHKNLLAEKYFLEMFRFCDQIYIHRDLPLEEYINDCLSISSFFLEAKQFERADFYLGKLKEVPAGTTSVIVKERILHLQFKADSARGYLVEAIRRFQKYKNLNDSAYNVTTRRQIEELEIKYQTGQKEKDFKLLQATDKLHQREFEQSLQYRKFYGIGILMLVLLLGVGYSRYRNKIHHNAKLQQSQNEITNKNIALSRLVRENELLIREVHHRVKNNLQIVTSLLTSQSVFLKDEAALNAILDSQHRVQAMSLIHQKLYKTNNYANIYMPDYINDLLDYLKDSFKIKEAIQFDRDLDAIYLDVSQAVPIGLILNETVTNSIKYAFPENPDASVMIRLKENDAGEISLQVIDNGVGLPDSYNKQANNSFGLSLIKGLVRDLDGTIRMQNAGGVSITILFNRHRTFDNPEGTNS